MSKENIRIIKFQFDAQIGKLILPVKFACKIKLNWKRSSQQTQIQPLSLTNGVLDFDRKISLNVNMYFDTVQQKFLQKKSLFSLIIITEKGQKAAGYVTIDLADKLNERVQQYSNKYPLQKCPMKDSSLQISIVSHLLQEKDLDSISQMSKAPDMPQTSFIGDQSVAGESFYNQKDQKSSHPTRDDRSEYTTGDILESNSISDNLLKINDVSSKINDFVIGFSSNMKSEIEKLKEKNKLLEQRLKQSQTSKNSFEIELQTLKTQNRQLKQRLQNTGDDHAGQIQRLNASLIQANSKVEQAEQSKKALESANLAGQNEQIQYLNEQIAQKQTNITKLIDSKNDISEKLDQQKRQSNQYRSKISNLEQELSSLQQKYSSLSALKNELQSERRNNQEQVQSAKIRLQRVYQQMLSSLKDLI